MKQTFENADLNVFCNNFDIVQNALQMRTLRRWNGRDLRDEENLAEHRPEHDGDRGQYLAE